jgi:hypothetical protein
VLNRLPQLSLAQFDRSQLQDDLVQNLKPAVRTPGQAARENGLPDTRPTDAWQDMRDDVRLALRLRCACVELAGGHSIFNWFFKDMGTTGVYFLYDIRHRVRAVYKPEDEQLDNSPKRMQRVKYAFQTGPLTPECLAPQGHECLRPRFAPYAEATAYFLVHQMRQRYRLDGVQVPEAHMVSLSSDEFHQYQGAPVDRMGSLSLFVENSRPAELRDAHLTPFHAKYLDFLFHGIDWKIDRLRREAHRWWIIDFGASFPERNPRLRNSLRNMNQWRHYPSSNQHWPEHIRNFHAAVYPHRAQLNYGHLNAAQRAHVLERWAILDASIQANETPRELAAR